MEANSSCNLCTKISFDLHCEKHFRKLALAPSTFDCVLQQYEWRDFDLMRYAVVPKTILPHGVQVDVYVCMDEDDLDDVNIKQYAAEFFTRAMLPMWHGFSVHHISEPTDEPPFELGCTKVKHHA